MIICFPDERFHDKPLSQVAVSKLPTHDGLCEIHQLCNVED